MKEYCSLNSQAIRCMIQQPLDLPYDGVNRLREKCILGNPVVFHYNAIYSSLKHLEFFYLIDRSAMA